MNPPIFIPLVNSQDEIIGHEEKLRVHELGLLHRAFSILIFNSKNEMLIHQRALGKYHSAGLWTNACCGHPNEGEAMHEAASRRLREEMGFTCPLHFHHVFAYQAQLENSLIENEIDHVYIGTYEGACDPNPTEVADYRWISLPDLKLAVSAHPEHYTFWFKEIIKNAQYESALT